MNSLTVCAGTFGLTSITFGARMNPATGAMSRMKSNGRFLYVQAGINGIGGIDQKQGIAIGRGVDRDFGCEIVAGARLVLDRELLVQMFGEVLSDQPRANVGRAARWIANQPAHRMIGIVIIRSARGTRDRDNAARSKRQRCNCPAQSPHSDPPYPFCHSLYRPRSVSLRGLGDL